MVFRKYVSHQVEWMLQCKSWKMKNIFKKLNIEIACRYGSLYLALFETVSGLEN